MERTWKSMVTRALSRLDVDGRRKWCFVAVMFESVHHFERMSAALLYTPTRRCYGVDEVQNCRPEHLVTRLHSCRSLDNNALREAREHTRPSKDVLRNPERGDSGNNIVGWLTWRKFLWGAAHSSDARGEVSSMLFLIRETSSLSRLVPCRGMPLLATVPAVKPLKQVAKCASPRAPASCSLPHDSC